MNLLYSHVKGVVYNMTDEETLRCRVFLSAGLDPWAEFDSFPDERELTPQEKLDQAEPVACEVLEA